MANFDNKFQGYDDFDASDNSDEHWNDVFDSTPTGFSGYGDSSESEASLDDLIPQDFNDYNLSTRDFADESDDLGFDDPFADLSEEVSLDKQMDTPADLIGYAESSDVDFDILSDLADNKQDVEDFDDSEEVEIAVELPASLAIEISDALGNMHSNDGLEEGPSLDELTAELLEGHMHIYAEGEELVSETYEGETNVTDEEVAMFLDSTEEGNKQSLVPESSIEVTGPSFVLKRVTVEEIAFFKRHGLLKSDMQDETLWNLLCDVGGNVMFLGKVENTLRTYLMLKQLYPEREVYCRGLDGAEDVIVEPEDLSFMLLEDLNFTKE